MFFFFHKIKNRHERSFTKIFNKFKNYKNYYGFEQGKMYDQLAEYYNNLSKEEKIDCEEFMIQSIRKLLTGNTPAAGNL